MNKDFHLLRPVSFLLSHSGCQLISRNRHSGNLMKLFAKSHERPTYYKTLFLSDILRRKTQCSLLHGYSCAPLGHLLNRYLRPSQWISIPGIAPRSRAFFIARRHTAPTFQAHCSTFARSFSLLAAMRKSTKRKCNIVKYE